MRFGASRISNACVRLLACFLLVLHVILFRLVLWHASYFRLRYENSAPTLSPCFQGALAGIRAVIVGSRLYADLDKLAMVRDIRVLRLRPCASAPGGPPAATNRITHWHGSLQV